MNLVLLVTLGITAGSADSTHPSAVFIRGRLGTATGYCSGVVVAPRVVLTAAHCVNVTGAEFRVFVGDDYFDGGTLLEVSEYHAHPAYQPATNLNDIGVLVTSAAIPVPPVALNRSPPAVGDPLTIVGYGQSVAGDNTTVGKRRVALTSVTAVDPLDLTLQGTPSFCFYDSGGPSYLPRDGGEVVAGIHYIVEAATCDAHAYDMRVDKYVSFIDGYIAATTADAGVEADAGVAVDAGVVVDAGVAVDAGVDAGSPPVDAGVVGAPDAGTAPMTREPTPHTGCSVASGPLLFGVLLVVRRAPRRAARR